MNDRIQTRAIEDLLGSRERVKILKILARDSELTISLIINMAKLNHSSARKHLKILKDLNFVQEKRFGRIKIYRFKIENAKARSLKNFIEIWEGKMKT